MELPYKLIFEVVLVAVAMAIYFATTWRVKKILKHCEMIYICTKEYARDYMLDKHDTWKKMDDYHKEQEDHFADLDKSLDEIVLQTKIINSRIGDFNRTIVLPADPFSSEKRKGGWPKGRARKPKEIEEQNG